MVMMVEPLTKCVENIQLQRTAAAPVVLFSPAGKQLDHAMVARWAASSGAVSPNSDGPRCCSGRSTAGLAWAFTSREAIPCPSICWAEAQRENKTNERRVIVIARTYLGFSIMVAMAGRVKVYSTSNESRSLLIRLRAWFNHQLVAIVLRFFGGRLLAGLRQPLKQLWNLRLIIRLPEGEDQVIQGGLIFRIIL